MKEYDIFETTQTPAVEEGVLAAVNLWPDERPAN